MAEQETPNTENQSTSDATQNTVTTDDKKPVPYYRFQEVVTEKNAAQALLDTIKKERDAAKAAAESAEAEKLKEQGKYKELYEQATPKIATLEERAKIADTYEASLKEMLEAQLKTVPDYLKPLLEKMSPLEAMKWITENADKVNAKNNGNTRSPAGNGVTSELTDEELKFIKDSGISEASYLRAKAAQAQPSKFTK